MLDARKLLDELLGAGAATRQSPADSGNATLAGGFATTAGHVLGQATSGLKDAARDIEARTGIGSKASDALKQATGGQGAGDLLNQARELASQNKLATGVALGGLAGLLLGTGAGRGIAVSAAKLGGLAVIGGLAYKALQNYQAGKPLIDLGGAVEPAPAESPLGDTTDAAKDNETAMLIVRTMIAAAAADGVVDNAERSRIVGSLERAGLDVTTAKFLDQEFARPASVETLAASAPTPAVAAQMYTAARLVVNPDRPADWQFLARLAAALKLSPELVSHLDASTRGAQQPG